MAATVFRGRLCRMGLGFPRGRIEDVRADAVGDPCRGSLDGVPRIARGRVYLVVTEQLADHRQALAERQRPAREGMAQVLAAAQQCRYLRRARYTSRGYFECVARDGAGQ